VRARRRRARARHRWREDRARRRLGRSMARIAPEIASGVVGLRRRRRLRLRCSMLRWRPLVFLGTVSYSIYMTHVFVEQRIFDVASALNKISHLNPFTHREIAGQDIYFLGTRLWHGDLAYLVYLALVVVMSYFTYCWIEKPAREWVRNRVQRRQAIPVTQHP